MNGRTDSDKQRKEHKNVFKRCLAAAVLAPQVLWMCGEHGKRSPASVLAEPLDRIFVDVLGGRFGLRPFFL